MEATLAAAGQHMIAEPPDFSRMLGATGEQTLGGIVATNFSGPRRIAAGAVRDHVLGVRAVNGTGETFHSGGRVLKNVTGLDLCKLLAGSHGTLAVLTEITFKVLPAPEDSCSVVLQGLEPAAAVAALAAAMGSPFGVSGAAHLPPAAGRRSGADQSLTLARLEDFAASVAYRGEKLRAALSDFGRAEIWPAETSRAAWASIRDAHVLPADADHAVWRVSVRPSRGPAVLAAARDAGADGYLDWAGGLLMLAGPATETCTPRSPTPCFAPGASGWCCARPPLARERGHGAAWSRRARGHFASRKGGAGSGRNSQSRANVYGDITLSARQWVRTPARFTSCPRRPCHLADRWRRRTYSSYGHCRPGARSRSK